VQERNLLGYQLAAKKLMPVKLPPGRARLVTKPSRTGPLRCYEGWDEQAALGRLPGHFGRPSVPALRLLEPHALAAVTNIAWRMRRTCLWTSSNRVQLADLMPEQI